MDQQIIIFSINDQAYGINIEKVSEISKVLPITPLPNQRVAEGMIDVRGSIHTVYSLRKMLGFETKEIDDQAKMIILREGKVALIADDVTDMVDIPEENMQDMRNITIFENQDSLSYVAEWNNKLVTVVNVDFLLPKKEAVPA